MASIKKRTKKRKEDPRAGWRKALHSTKYTGLVIVEATRRAHDIERGKSPRKSFLENLAKKADAEFLGTSAQHALDRVGIRDLEKRKRVMGIVLKNIYGGRGRGHQSSDIRGIQFRSIEKDMEGVMGKSKCEKFMRHLRGDLKNWPSERERAGILTSENPHYFEGKDLVRRLVSEGEWKDLKKRSQKPR